jgi:hypothetical protein
VTPLGGAGCFYRRRILTGSVVAVASFLAGSTMLVGLHQGDKDASILGAVSYGAARLAGLFGAVWPDTPNARWGAPAPSALPPSMPPAKMVGLAHTFTF